MKGVPGRQEGHHATFRRNDVVAVSNLSVPMRRAAGAKNVQNRTTVAQPRDKQPKRQAPRRDVQLRQACMVPHQPECQCDLDSAMNG